MGLPVLSAITRAAEATTIQPELCPTRCRPSGARPALIKASAMARPWHSARAAFREGKGPCMELAFQSQPRTLRLAPQDAPIASP